MMTDAELALHDRVLTKLIEGHEVCLRCSLAIVVMSAGDVFGLLDFELSSIWRLAGASLVCYIAIGAHWVTVVYGVPDFVFQPRWLRVTIVFGWPAVIAYGAVRKWRE